MLRLYNSRTREVDVFTPLSGNHVGLYVCGLTPSAEPHLGHARSFLFFDVLRRYLRHRGYEVTYVRNVTDIDDRSIAQAKATGEDWRSIVDGYFASFTRSMRRLGLAEPDREPRATGYVSEIVAMIEALVSSGHAYAASDGVYFRVASFPHYGALSGKKTDELLVGARIAENEGKDDPLDFALWKFAKADEPSWPSPWGDGRPGWHIECSAMSRALLGEPFDIHGGGFDLIFPHHENEIAQSESLMAEPPMANVWVHGGLLMFDNRKMSKSLGNFEPLSALLDRHDPQAIRLLFLQTGYRKPMNFTEESIAAATAGLGKLRRAWRTMFADVFGGAATHDQLLASVREAAAGSVADHAGVIAAVERAMDDDVNTSAALAALFECSATKARADDARKALGAFTYALSLVCLYPDEGWLAEAGAPAVDIEAVATRLRAAVGDAVHLNGGGGAPTIDAIIAARNAARKNKDFSLADRLRGALASERILLHDSKDGTTWSVGE